MKSNNQVVRRLLLLSTAKKIVFILCFFSLCIGFGQSTYSYYVVQKDGFSLEPTSKTTNTDGTLALTFSSSSLNNFFQTKTVYEYKKAFPAGISTYLDKVYRIDLTNSTFVSNLNALSEIEFAELDIEGNTLLEPNDPYYVAGDIGKTYLELVRANKAWNITTGEPSVIVGIVDTKFEMSHEDLNGQMLSIYGPNNSSNLHGIWVSGFVSPKTNNGLGVAGIGYNTKMVGITGGLSTYTLFDFVIAHPAIRIINASWTDGCTLSPIKQEIYDKIRNHYNVLVVAAAGNGSTCGGPNNYVYPAAYNNVLSVSSVGHWHYFGHSDYQNWKDFHQNHIDPLNPEQSTHQHNDKVDMVAPGYDFWTTGLNNTYKYIWSGTSSASPMVAAAGALLLSIDPTLTANQLEQILKSTADDIYWMPYNQPYLGKLGTGRLNVFRAVKTAYCLDESNPQVELVVRDSNEDVGNEPNNQSSLYWKSNDIWVRNQNDGKYNDTHQNVLYSIPHSLSVNYVYVRLTNYGCKTSSGEDQVSLYWAKNATSLPWPSAWDGSGSIPPKSGLIGTVTVPALEPGQETVLSIAWIPPNPADFSAPISLNGNFSLLARVVSDDDPITYTNGSNINNYTKFNNNVAWKNINIINVSTTNPITMAAFYVSNPEEQAQSYTIELVEHEHAQGKSLFEEAEISVKMDDTIHNAWLEGGSNSSDMESTNVDDLKLVKGNTSEIGNIMLQPDESGVVEIGFNFLTRELTDKTSYEYDVIQRNTATGEIVGGMTIIINKENRDAFLADAEVLSLENSTTIQAEDIGEPAVYNWYDSEGNLIHTGTEITLSPVIAQTYKLEVISELDGFKDYKEMEIPGNSPYTLGTLVPNPASSQITVSYDATSATSAYLMITNTATGSSNNHILNTANTQATLSLSAYPNGIYTVTLVCNGAIVESKNLIKN